MILTDHRCDRASPSQQRRKRWEEERETAQAGHEMVELEAGERLCRAKERAPRQQAR